MPIPKFLISIGLMAANMAFTAMRKIEGPRLDDLKFTGGDYGSPLAMVWGKRRLQCPIFWAEDLKEVKQQRKTKGGKFNEYTYFGTWAVALAGHEIAGVTRIWFDTHLVYDMTGAGPVTPFDFGKSGSGKSGGGFGLGGFSLNDHMAIYYGTETQEPDPRIQATVEAAQGEGSCPAYRGTAYIVFKDMPLEKLGNRIPQISVELSSVTSGQIPTENYTPAYDPNTAFNLKFSPDYGRVSWMDTDGGVEIWDGPARASMLAFDSGISIYPTATFGVYNDGSILCIEDGSVYPGGDLYRITPDGEVSKIADYDGSQFGCTVVADGAGVEHFGTYPFSFGGTWYYDGAAHSPGWQACMYFPDAYGNIWAAGRTTSATSTVHFLRLTLVDNEPGYLGSFSATVASVSTSANGEDVYCAASGDNFILRWGGNHYLIDPTDGSILDTVSAPDEGTVYTRKTNWANLVPGAGSFWLGNSQYELLTGELIRTVTAVPAGAGQFESVYDPINHAIWTNNDGLTIYYLDRITGDGALLSQVGDDLAGWIGAQDCNFSAWDAAVNWSMTQGQASNGLEPLLDANDCDIAPHDFGVRGTKRTGVTTGTLATAHFAKESGARYTLKVRQAAELPKALVYNFADTTADQQPNNVRVSRPLDATDASDERTLDLTTLADDPDGIRGKADRHFRRLWNSRKEASFALTFQNLAIAPADVKTPQFDDESFTARCVKTVIRASGVIATEWTYDHPSLATLDNALGANFDGRNPSVIVIAGIAKGFTLDIPLLRDADNSANPLIYLLASPYSDNIAFPGAVTYQAIDGDYSDDIGSVDSASRATWGYATDVLSDADPWLWDRGSSVNVKLQVGSLTGTTEAAIDANPNANLCLLGDELLNFTTATLEGDGTYTLSGFKRGRRGTEWACGTHAARDVFLMLETAQDVEMGLSEVGTDLSFKTVTNGRNLDSAFVTTLEPYTGATLKPYAPCQLGAEQDAGTGDWTLTWVRRTRVGGAWTSGTGIPLSEASEEYEVDILGDDGTTVVQTYTGLSSPAAQYSVADQEADFGVSRSSFDWRAYQISDAVGRGFAAEGTAGGGEEAIGKVFATEWRLRFPQGSISWTETNIWEVEMRPRWGGTDQCSGGAADASTIYSGGFAASNAFDNTLFGGSPWAPSTGNATSWLRYTFAAAVYVAQFTVSSSGAFGPKQIVLEYWDGAAWQSVHDTGTIASWGTNETRTYNVT